MCADRMLGCMCCCSSSSDRGGCSTLRQRVGAPVCCAASRGDLRFFCKAGRAGVAAAGGWVPSAPSVQTWPDTASRVPSLDMHRGQGCLLQDTPVECAFRLWATCVSPA